jgi:hypothetical protein
VRRPVSSLLVLLALTAAFAAGAGPASAARGLEVGLQDDGVFVQQAWYSRERALDRAQRLGVTRLRVNVLWSRVVTSANDRRPPKHVLYDWSAYDGLIFAAAAHGIRLQMTLAGPAPRWATADHRIGNVDPNPKLFALFARDAAEHFRGRVDRYSIWNEPNWHTWLTPGAGCRHGRWGAGCDRRLASLYRSMYRLAYEAIKVADPTASVLFGEFAPQGRGAAATPPLAMLRDVTCSTRAWRARRRCAGLMTDGFAHHPYAFTTRPDSPYGGRDDVVLGTLGRLTRALDRLGRRGALTTPAGRTPLLYLTEHGYFATGRRRMPAAVRASWLTRSFDIALRNRRVRQLVQYLLVQPPVLRNTFPTQIMTSRGRPTAPFKALEKWSRRNRHRIARPAAIPAPRPAATATPAGWRRRRPTPDAVHARRPTP